MAYEEYINAGRCPGKVLRQLSEIGVPIRFVSDVRFTDGNEVFYNGQVFCTYKYNEFDTPVFKFHPPYESFQQLKQPYYVVLFGMMENNEYKEVGVFTDVNAIHFKEKVQSYAKTYLADFDGKPLREQVLHTTTMEDKISRLQDKFQSKKRK